MVLIFNRFEKTEEEKLDSLDNINRVELFYKVYRQMNYLTLRELKILRNFCYALHNPYDLTIASDYKTESEEEVYYKYSGVLDNYMEKKINRKTISKL